VEKSEFAMRMAGICDRTKQFALRVVGMYASLPNETVAQVMGKQVLRSGTSVAANFREASRARSNAEFISKLGIVEQELDESILWFELLVESGIVSNEKLQPLLQEAEELIKIIVTAIKKTKEQGRK
jgi:four helix bundle protein